MIGLGCTCSPDGTEGRKNFAAGSLNAKAPIVATKTFQADDLSTQHCHLPMVGRLQANVFGYA
jgi:hypothetical protein